uniref:Uncharacterized protein n=1 Tax=Peronospora matthiolae TaxID=2874970 RepID=A0AAV1UHS6_9STRA
METAVIISEAQQTTLEKLKALIGHEQVALIMAQGPEALHIRLEASSTFESRWSDSSMTIWHLPCPLGIFQYRTLSQELVL